VTQNANKHDDARAFTRGTGFIFQIVGFAMMLGGCCLGMLIGYLQGEQEHAPANIGEWVRQSPPGQLLTAINIIISGVAGLALMVFGVGLQQERRRSGIGAVICSGLLALGLWATTVAAAVWTHSVIRVLIGLVLAGAASFLLFLAIGAARELRLYPPPPDEPVTDAFLAQFARRRHRVEEDDESLE